MEKDPVIVPLSVSAAINRLDGNLDLGADAQLLCHVEALRFRKILGTELQEVDRPLAPEPRLLELISLSP